MLVIQPDSSQVRAWLLCFPREKKKRQLSSEEAKELSFASERISDAPPAEPSTCAARTFTDRGPRRECWGNPNLDMNWAGKGKGWRENDGGSGEVRVEEEACGR